MGDKVLKAIAETLSRGVRPYDLVARYGGEEFLVLLPSTTQEDAGISAERLRSAISKITLEGLNGKITASFGVATLLPGQSSQTLFERADKALYHAKTNGRNQVAFEPVDRRNGIDD
jgi:diguanylate cyclase (GGDEF)-like protein